MAAIFQADIYCDACAESIRYNLCTELWYNRDSSECPDGTPVTNFGNFTELANYLDSMDEFDYDSDEFPKYYYDSAESDSPQHCGAHGDCINFDRDNCCSCFLGNDLTSEGYDYVKGIIESDLLFGNDSIATKVWMPYYNIDLDIEQCNGCTAWFRSLDDNGFCSFCSEIYNNDN